MKNKLNASILYLPLFLLTLFSCGNVEEEEIIESDVIAQEELEEEVDPFYAGINENSTLDDYWDLFVKDAIQTKYELENNFTYDCVMLTRFDISFMTDLIFDKYDMNYIYASGQKNKDHVHVSSNEFISDWWFFSNSNVMNEFSKVYDEIDEIGKYGEWWDQHRMAKAKIIKMGMNDNVKYLFKLAFFSV